MSGINVVELTALVVLVVTVTLASLNALSYFLMRVTEKYKTTDNKVDDFLHRKARIVIRAIEEFNKIFLARY